MSNADEDTLRAMRAANPALQKFKWWPDSENPRSWKGVRWSDGRVQELTLIGSKLVVSPHIEQLQALTQLCLYGGPLKELPPEIAQLRALTTLTLIRCPLVELPPEIGQLKTLTTLTLIRCPLVVELPPQVGQLQALTALTLTRCPLVELPPEVGQLRALTMLNLERCALKGLPPQIGLQLQALTRLDLRGCALVALPPEIGQLAGLASLDLGLCPLRELPPQIGQLLALTYLELMGCPLKELPPEIAQLLALSSLLLYGCKQLTLAPGANAGQSAQTIVAAYASLLIVEPHKDAPGELHAFLLANPLTVAPFFKSILTDAAHAAWLGEAVKAAPELAGLPDALGRRVIDAAHLVCKQAMQARCGVSADVSRTLAAHPQLLRIVHARTLPLPLILTLTLTRPQHPHPQPNPNPIPNPNPSPNPNPNPIPIGNPNPNPTPTLPLPLPPSRLQKERPHGWRGGPRQRHGHRDERRFAGVWIGTSLCEFQVPAGSQGAEHAARVIITAHRGVLPHTHTA